MTYRVTGTFVPSDGKKTVDVPNVLGDVTPTPVPGEVHFTLNGRELTLTALSGDPSKGLSFVIADLTSKTETYPGGRFLDSDPVVNGNVVLDFNRAYNPPCAVTPYATCPLAPKENHLPVAVAGAARPGGCERPCFGTTDSCLHTAIGGSAGSWWKSVWPRC